MRRVGMMAVAAFTALLLALAACSTPPPPEGTTAAQQQTCRDRGGSLVGPVEDDGDVACDYRTKRRNCKASWQDIVRGGSFGSGSTRITCRIEITSSGAIDKN